MYKPDKITVKEYNKTRITAGHAPLCKAPFSNLYFSRNGNIVCCCFNRDVVLGRYPENTLKELWNGIPSKTFRQKLNNNILPRGCDICIRELSNKNYQGVIARHFDFLRPQGKYPVMMEFELDNTCNLECKMCEGTLSSSIRRNRESESEIISPYQAGFVDYIKPFLLKARLLRFSGGEPFLIPVYYKIWDLTLKENRKCMFFVQTNGTIINEKIKDFLATGRFELGISLDSLIPECFEHIRKNARFSDVMHNIETFISLLPYHKKHPSLVISTTVIRDNWSEIPQITEFANARKSHIVFNTVWAPEDCAVFNLNSSELKKILDYYNSCIPASNTEIEKHNAFMFSALRSQIKGWYENALFREKHYALAETLSCDDLEKHIQKIILNHSENKEEAAKKIHSLFQFARQKKDQRRYLMFISGFAADEIARSVDLYTIEELINLLENKISAFIKS